MFRVKLANVFAHRTGRPLHEQHQATPLGTFLDPAETGNVYSGMVATKTGPDLVALCDGNTQTPFGLFALDKNTVIDDTEGQDQLLFAVWQGGPDAYFQIDAPAFDDTQTYTVNTNGTAVPLYAGTSTAKGKLTSATPGGSAKKVAELIQVVSASRIIVRLEAPVAL